MIVITSPDSDETLSRLRSWTDDQGIDLVAVDVGDDIDDVYDPSLETLGVTLGGDGTYLEGLRVFSPKDIPQLGVNTGTLAFLASLSPSDLTDALDEVVRGRAAIDTRQQLRVHSDEKDLDTTGINDVMLQTEPPDDPVDRMISRLQVFADDEFVGEYEGTGLAISTPTGSTGVSLSANGPVHYPKNNSTLQIVPMQTHKMGVRPVVVSSTVELRIVSKGTADLLVDGGRAHRGIEPGDTITVTGAESPAHIVNTSYDDGFFLSISEKLGWGIHAGTEDAERASAIDADQTEETSSRVVARAREVAEEAARSAGGPLRELHGEVESVEFKTDKSDIVTEADFKAENIITTIIEGEFPDHAIYSEEDVQREGTSEYTWMIDPLDGTGNYAHGNPNYAVSIGLLEDEQPVMGVVYAPATDEMFSATVGGTPHRNGTPIETTTRDQIDECMLLSGYDPDGTFLATCYSEARGVRRLGSAALHLCYLASGVVDGIWEYDTYPWDVAAGLVIARTAGAEITGAEGGAYAFSLEDHEQRAELLGSNGHLHGTLTDHLSSNVELRNTAAEAAAEEQD